MSLRHEFVVRTPAGAVAIEHGGAAGEVAARLGEMFASYAVDSSSATDTAAARLVCRRQPQESLDDALARLEGEFYRYVLAAAPRHGFVGLHAAAIACGDSALMLLGESGSGKSTLTLELLLRIPGARYVTDDIALLRTSSLSSSQRLEVCGLPRLIGFDEPPSVSPPEAFRVTQWSATGKVPDTTLARTGIAVPPGRVRQEPAALHAIVLPRYVEALRGGAALVEPVTAHEATAAIWQAILGEPPPHRAFEDVATVLATVPVVRLQSGTPESAVRAMIQHDLLPECAQR